MRRKNSTQQWFLTVVTGLALLGPARVALADPLIVNSFDTGVSGIDWENFRSYAYSHTEAWDAAQDSQGNANSGSMYLTVNWPLKSDPNWNQSWNDVQIGFGTGSFSSSDYIAFQVDIKIDVTNSYPALDGSYGAVELIVNNPWTGVVGWAPLVATNGWQRISGFFSGIPAATYSEAVIGFISNGGGGFITIPLLSNAISVTAAASVPSSFTSTNAFCRTSEI